MGIRGSTEEALYTTTQPVCPKCKGKGFVITDVLNGRTSKCECQLPSLEEEAEEAEADVAVSGAQPCNTMPAPGGLIFHNKQPEQLTPEEIYKQLAGQAEQAIGIAADQLGKQTASEVSQQEYEAKKAAQHANNYGYSAEAAKNGEAEAIKEYLASEHASKSNYRP